MIKRKSKQSKDTKEVGKFLLITSDEIGERFRSYCQSKGYTFSYVLEDLLISLLVKEGVIDPEELE